MVETRDRLASVIRRYVQELERLGVPVERVILYGSCVRGEARADSDIDLAVFSEVFGGKDHLEFAGVLSEAKWNTEPMIEAIGFHPSVLEHVPPISFLREITSSGEVAYRRDTGADAHPHG